MIMKSLVIQNLANEVGLHSANTGGSAVTQIVKIEECPDTMRHACVYRGISRLPKSIYNVQTDCGILSIPYYFCNTCGKLYIYNDFM